MPVVEKEEVKKQDEGTKHPILTRGTCVSLEGNPRLEAVKAAIRKTMGRRQDDERESSSSNNEGYDFHFDSPSPSLVLNKED